MSDFEAPYDTGGAPNPLQFGCPHCGHETIYARVLVDLRVVRCNQCSGAFSRDGKTLADELARALGAMDEVVHGKRRQRGLLGVVGAHVTYIDGVSTASERGYWLRDAFRQHGLDPNTPLFVATRRQLARCYGQREPELAAREAGYRGETQSQIQTWQGEVERMGLFGSNTLEVREDVIACGRAKVERERAVFFRIARVMRGDPAETVAFRLDCVRDDLRATAFITVSPNMLGELQSAVQSMEAALGWLHQRRG